MKRMLSKIMRRAWEIKKQDSRNIFSLCLKMAWGEVKSPLCSKIIAAGYLIKEDRVLNHLHILVNGQYKEVPFSDRKIILTKAGLETTGKEIYSDWRNSHKKEQTKEEKRIEKLWNEREKETTKIAKMVRTDEKVNFAVCYNVKVGDRISYNGRKIVVDSVDNDIDYNDIKIVVGYVLK